MSASSYDQILSLEDLRVKTEDGTVIVDGMSLSLRPGEILGLVGESGSGKTTTALALLGYETSGTSMAIGKLTIAGRSFRTIRDIKDVRGKLISYIPQSPGTTLNPSQRIGRLLTDIYDEHRPKSLSSQQNHSQVLAQVGLPCTDDFLRRYPHQLSGGQQQRVCTAVAITGRPPVIVLDEPTTGLDVITQAQVLAELRRLRDEEQVAMVYVTHDLAAIAQIADRVAVMQSGQLVEEGTTEEVLKRPKQEYTRELLASVLDHRNPKPLLSDSTVATKVNPTESAPSLEVRNLRAVHKGRKSIVVAAEDVSFSIADGEIVALVGESGSGKSTIARTLAGLHPVDSGELRLQGEDLPGEAKRRSVEQRRNLQFVFQNPWEALNPRHTVRESIGRPIRVLRGLDRRDTAAEITRLLELVRLGPELQDRYPSELSGGQRQRVVIARALAAQPKLLICDEITSALDVSVQASVLKVLLELRQELDLSVLFITHDLGVVAAIADKLLVLERGQICERGNVRSVMAKPEHSYTKALVNSAPSLTRSPSKSPR